MRFFSRKVIRSTRFEIARPMFEKFLKTQSHVFHVEVRPDRINTRELTSGETVADAPVIALEMRNNKPIVKEIGEAAKSMDVMENVIVLTPFYDDGWLISDIDAAASIINHQLHRLEKKLPRKAFAPLIIFQPMEETEKGVSPDEIDLIRALGKRCRAKNVIVMEPDEYLDLPSGA